MSHDKHERSSAYVPRGIDDWPHGWHGTMWFSNCVSVACFKRTMFVIRPTLFIVSIRQRRSAREYLMKGLVHMRLVSRSEDQTDAYF